MAVIRSMDQVVLSRILKQIGQVVVDLAGDV
jgi:hypothetical protein